MAVTTSSDGERLLAAVKDGQLYTSADSGVSWTPQESARAWTSVASSADGMRLLASADNGQLYTSTDGGQSWIPRANNDNWASVASSSNGMLLFAAVSYAQLYASTDGGISWALRKDFSSLRSQLTVACSADGMRVFATMSWVQLYASNDGGVSWTAGEMIRNWAVSASSADGMRLVTAANNDQLYISTDRGSSSRSVAVTKHVFNGVSWTPRGAPRGWTSLAASADVLRVIAAASGDYLYTSVDGGVSWTPRDSVREWSLVASNADGTRLIAVTSSTSCNGPCFTRGLLYISSDGGESWTQRGSLRNWRCVASSADGMRIIAAANGEMVASYQGDNLYISSDGGVSWTPRAEARLWSSVASSADGMRLFAAAGQLFTSEDGGVTWAPRVGGIGMDSLASSADGMRLLAATFRGPLQVSTDGGVTWLPRGETRDWRGVVSSADGMRLVANAGQLVFSGDGGLTWVPRNPPSTNVGALASSADGTRLIAAADGLLYTMDTPPAFPAAAVAAASVATAARLQLTSADAVVSPRFISLASGEQLYSARVLSSRQLGTAAFSGWPRALTSLLLRGPEALLPMQFSQQGCLQGLASLALVNRSGQMLRLASTSLSTLTGLRTLSCRGSGIYSAAPGVLSLDALPAARLHLLDLAGSGLTALQSRSATGPPILDSDAVIDLSGNRFNDTSAVLPALGSVLKQVSGVLLSLADNSLDVVPPHAFANAFEGVVAIDLRNNGISSLADSAFDEIGNANLRELSLSGNALGGICRPGSFNRLASFRTRADLPFSFAACAVCPVGSFCPGDGRFYTCDAGLFSNAEAASSNATCLRCPQGTYNELRGQSRIGCVSCSPGYASAAVGATSASTCGACAAGLFASNPGQSRCTACPAGTCSSATAADSATTCQNCARGRYSSQSAALDDRACLSCRSAYTTAVSGASSADDCNVDLRRTCPAGTGFSAEAGACAACPPGWTGTPGDLGCVPCAAGTFLPPLTPNADASKCQRCANGTYSSLAGSTSASACLPCPTGFRPTASASRCLSCPPGRAAAIRGQDTCTVCANTSVCVGGVIAPLPRAALVLDHTTAAIAQMRQLVSSQPQQAGKRRLSTINGSVTLAATPTAPETAAVAATSGNDVLARYSSSLSSSRPLPLMSQPSCSRQLRSSSPLPLQPPCRLFCSSCRASASACSVCASWTCSLSSGRGRTARSCASFPRLSASR